MRLLRQIFSRHAFRPEVEAMLDAELRRHKQAVKKLVAYAIEQQATEAETTGDASGGATDFRDVRRTGAPSEPKLDGPETDERTEPG